MNKLFLTLTGFAILALLVTGYSDSDKDKMYSKPISGPKRTVFPNGHWVLEAGTINDKAFPFVEGQPITLNFSDWLFSISTGCNKVGDFYFLDGAEMIITGISGRAGIGCPPDILIIEHAFRAAMKQNWHLKRDGEWLTITTDGMNLSFKAATPPVNTLKVPDIFEIALKLTVLIRIRHRELVSPKTDASLELKPNGTFEAFTGCREISGNYIIKGNELHLSSMDADGDCPPELDRQDNLIASVFESSRIEFISDPGGFASIWLFSAEGIALLYQ